MSYTTNVVSNYQTAEYGKFIQFSSGDTRYPAVSVTRIQYPDSTLFQPGCALPPVSSVDIYPKYAVLVHDTSTSVSNALPFGDNGAIDAFGRLRVSNPVTLMDSKQLYGSSSLFDQVLSGSGDGVFISGDSAIYMRTFFANDFVIRQTLQRFNYQPGKSIQAFMTGTFGTQENIIKRVGMFSGSTTIPYNPIDGIYLENNSGNISLNILKTQGTSNTESIPQSAWNVDPMNGNGPSKIVLDLSKTTIFTLDYEWLGVGRVRAGFVIDGKTYYVHHFNHANSFSVAYMTSPNQPVRYEIRQTEIGSGEMQHICSTVISEGGEQNVGNPFSIYANSISNIGSTYFCPILILRKNMNYKNIVSQITELNVVNTNNQYGHFILIADPNISGGTVTFSNSAKGLEYAIGTNALSASGGTILYGGYVNKDSATGIIQVSEKCPTLGEKIDGTPQTIALAIKTFSGNGSFGGLVNVLERG